MGNKRTRTKRTSSGIRKSREHRSDRPRRGLAIADQDGLSFMKAQGRDRWPTEKTMDDAWRLKNERQPRRKPQKAVKPMQQGFTILDCLIGSCPHALDKLLLAASLKIKKVRRYPGYVLQRTYNLKNRTIEII